MKSMFGLVVYIVVLLASSLSFAADLGKNRTWSVDPTSLVQLVLNDKYDPETGSSSDSSGYLMDFEFGRNYGKYEFGPIFGYASVKRDNYNLKSSHYGAFARFNFKDNKVGEQMVPFLRASLVLGKDDYDYDGGGDYSRDAKLLTLMGGVDYFPFGDHFAMEGSLQYRSREYDVSNGTDYKLTGTFLVGGIRLYF